MVNKSKLKMNNRGSSLVFVLIAVAFVSILTAVIISASTTNYRLKVMNNYSKKTFYSAETALEEVYVGLGKVTCDTLEENYLEVAQNLTQRVEVGGNYITVKIDNDEANKQLKEQFFVDLKNLIFTKDSANALNSYLTSFLTSPDNAFVSSYGAILYDDVTCEIVIEDVIVQYKEKDTDYFSTVAVDMKIKYPDNEFDFISNTKSSLETFLDYSIIAMDGIEIGKDHSTSNGRISGGVYSGSDIKIGYDSTLKFGQADSDISSTIVAAGDITVMGKLLFDEGDLWGINLNASDETSGGAKLTFAENTRIFLADDLNIEGNNCVVTLGSEFFAFGNNGTGVYTEGYSSAIIVNGRASVINATNLSKFVIAGRAYIDFLGDKSVTYTTADALSLRGVQEIYLVPTFYMETATGAPATNPSNDASLDNAGLNNRLKEFFAYELLNQTQPVSKKTLNGVYYYYLNFKDSEAQKKYVNAILSDSYFDRYITNKGDNYSDDLKELRKIIQDNMDKFILGGEVNLGFNADAQIFTEGNLYRVNDTDKMSSAIVSVTYMEAAKICADKSNRYKVLRSFLYDIGVEGSDESCFLLADNITIQGNSYSTDDVDKAPYDRFIDIEELEKQTKNYYNVRPDGTLAAVFVADDASCFDAGVHVPYEVTGVSDGTVTIPAEIVGGVVLAYNLDVVVQGNFEGLIITNGKVYTKTNSSDLITSGVRDVASRVLDEDIKIAKFFYAYQMDSENLRDISIVDVADLLTFDNWRKNYDQ